ncbi:MAG: hypothetical protein ACYDER_15600 [Ktedonobacteraceae bacterium]
MRKVQKGNGRPHGLGGPLRASVLSIFVRSAGITDEKFGMTHVLPRPAVTAVRWVPRPPPITITWLTSPT